jgi:hypothetical protein
MPLRRKLQLGIESEIRRTAGLVLNRVDVLGYTVVESFVVGMRGGHGHAGDSDEQRDAKACQNMLGCHVFDFLP